MLLKKNNELLAQVKKVKTIDEKISVVDNFDFNDEQFKAVYKIYYKLYTYFIYAIDNDIDVISMHVDFELLFEELCQYIYEYIKTPNMDKIIYHDLMNIYDECLTRILKIYSLNKAFDLAENIIKKSEEDEIVFGRRNGNVYLNKALLFKSMGKSSNEVFNLFNAGISKYSNVNCYIEKAFYELQLNDNKAAYETIREGIASKFFNINKYGTKTRKALYKAVQGLFVEANSSEERAKICNDAYDLMAALDNVSLDTGYYRHADTYFFLGKISDLNLRPDRANYNYRFVLNKNVPFNKKTYTLSLLNILDNYLKNQQFDEALAVLNDYYNEEHLLSPTDMCRLSFYMYITYYMTGDLKLAKENSLKISDDNYCVDDYFTVITFYALKANDMELFNKYLEAFAYLNTNNRFDAVLNKIRYIYDVMNKNTNDYSLISEIKDSSVRKQLYYIANNTNDDYNNNMQLVLN